MGHVVCVEMFAVDFVMNPTQWRSGWVRQGIAVGSLVLGVRAMGVAMLVSGWLHLGQHLGFYVTRDLSKRP